MTSKLKLIGEITLLILAPLGLLYAGTTLLSFVFWELVYPGPVLIRGGLVFGVLLTGAFLCSDEAEDFRKELTR